MKTNLISFITLLCALASSPICSAQTEINAFKQGSVWIETHKSMFEPEATVYTYTIDGECEINGRTCMQLWEKITVTDNELSSGLFTYLYTEGDKVFFVPVNNPDAFYLMYDFGIGSEETTEVVDIVNYYLHGNDSYTAWTNVATSNVTNCGNVFECIEIASPNWGDETWHSNGRWIKGIGSERSLVDNIGYIDVVGLEHVSYVVIVDGEVVFRSDDSAPCAIDEVKAGEPVMRYNLDGTRARNNVRGAYVENHRVVLNSSK